MNKSKNNIKRFLLLPLVIYLILIFLFDKLNQIDLLILNNHRIYWENYFKLAQTFQENNIEMVLFSDYLSTYSIVLDPFIFFKANNLLFFFPQIILSVYLLPLCFLPSFLLLINKKNRYILIIITIIFYSFYLIKMTSKSSLKTELLIKKEMKNDLLWYKKNRWKNYFRIKIIREIRNTKYLEKSEIFIKKHDLLSSWYYLQKAKNTGIKTLGLNKKLKIIELALLREYQIKKFSKPMKTKYN